MSFTDDLQFGLCWDSSLATDFCSKRP